MLDLGIILGHSVVHAKLRVDRHSVVPATLGSFAGQAFDGHSIVIRLSLE